MALAEALRNMADQTRVMLVEDSAVVRGMVRKWLQTIPGIEVVESAENGQVAIDRVADLRPDIIILDIEMPVMDGITALPTLLRKAPKAKVLVASTLSRRNAEISLKAMNLGASDCIAKPSFVHDGNAARAQFQDDLVRKIEGMAHAHKVVPASKDGDGWAPMPSAGSTFSFRKPSLVAPRVLVIGSSTGGPAALTRVFNDAKSIMAGMPILVAQHMPPTFTTLLGEKLASTAGLQGGEAHDGQPLLPGHLYVAPGGKHMRVQQKGGQAVVALDDGPPINHCRPAVDPLFESAAGVFGNATLAAVLTGMGSDGALGAERIADAGGTVLAQDAASSIVWGMPGAVAARGAASALIDLSEMGARLCAQVTRGTRK